LPIAVVVTIVVPSKSVTLYDEQYAHIVQTQGKEQSFSDRLREVVDKGIEAEKDD